MSPPPELSIFSGFQIALFRRVLPGAPSQIEIFFGFFLTSRLCNLNHALRDHPLLSPLQTQEGLSEARHLPCKPTGVAVKKSVKFSANWL
jgi:hypothetical protein